MAPTLLKSVRTVREDVDGLIEDVTALAQTAGAKAKAQALGLALQARTRGRDALGAVQKQVRERPGLALGAALGVGLVAGLLLMRRR